MADDTPHAAVVESLKATASELHARPSEEMNQDWADRMAEALAAAGLLAAPAAQPSGQVDRLADLTARLGAADAGWCLTYGDERADPAYIRWLARHIDAFEDHASPAARSHRARHDVYVRLSDEDVAKTRGPWDGVNVDLDEDDQVVGVEVLAALEIAVDGRRVAAPAARPHVNETSTGGYLPRLPIPGETYRDATAEPAEQLRQAEVSRDAKMAMPDDTTGKRIALDDAGDTWDEIEPGLFKARCGRGHQCDVPGECHGDELLLAELAHGYGLRSLGTAPSPTVDRETLLDALKQADADFNHGYRMTDYLEHLADALIAAGYVCAPGHEWQCPGCGATTRARMADHPTERAAIAGTP